LGGFIYNISSAAELYADKTDPAIDLRPLDIGGGPGGVGPTKAYYARMPDVDLFVTHRVSPPACASCSRSLTRSTRKPGKQRRTNRTILYKEKQGKGYGNPIAEHH